MSSIITKEMIEKIIKSQEKCTHLNDDYVLLYKSMEVPDTQLDEYLERIKNAQTSGINIPKVVEYKLLNNSVGNASKGIFIEERAKGNVLNIRGIVLKRNQEYDFKEIIALYLDKVSKYLEELEKRAKAPQEFYNKFLKDFINLHSFGLRPDPNSLNYLFDERVGFTIIDPYFNEQKSFNEKDLFKYIVNDIYGVSRPNILIKKDNLEAFYYLPENLKSKLDNFSSQINKKICLAFFEAGYSPDYIIENLEQNRMRFFTENESLELEALISKLEEQFYDNNRKQI